MATQFLPVNTHNISEATAESAVPRRQPAVPGLPRTQQATVAALEKAALTLPHAYQDGFATPLISFLDGLDSQTYYQYINDNERYPFNDFALAVIQNDTNQTTFDNAVNAFQELISDLYDTFLTKYPSDPIQLPPLVKFGNADFGPYTIPGNSQQSQQLNIQTGIVSLPQYLKDQGVLAWSSLGHEVGGHDVLGSIDGLEAEVGAIVSTALRTAGRTQRTRTQWVNWLGEAGADILSILNIGPAAAVGLIGYFRTFRNGALLNTPATPDDVHPVDIFRAYLAAEVLELVGSTTKSAWAAEVRRLAKIDLDSRGGYALDSNNKRYTEADIIADVKIVASAVLRTPIKTLHKRTFTEFVDWDDEDETTVAEFYAALKAGTDVHVDSGYEAGYAVSAAVLFAVSSEGAGLVSNAFKWLIQQLDNMNKANPRWQQPVANGGRRLLKGGRGRN